MIGAGSFHQAVLSRGAVVLDACIVLVTVAQVALFSRIVEPFVLRSTDVAAVIPAAALLLTVTAVRALVLGAREAIGLRAAARAKSSLRRAALSRLVQLGPTYLRGERASELVTLLGTGLERVDVWISRYLPQRILTITGPLLIAAYVCWLDPFSALLLVASAPVLPLLMIAVGSYTEARTRAQWTALLSLSTQLYDLIQGLPTLKLFGRESFEQGRVARLGETFRAKTIAVLKEAFLSGLVLELLTTAAVAVVAVELGLRLLDSAIGFGQALQILLLAPEFYRPLRELGAHRHAALESRPVLERLTGLALHPVRPPPLANRVDQLAVGEIAFDAVGYRYLEAATSALDDVTLRLPSGSRTALVGPSGAGKTTLVQLLVRFLEPTSGCIRANGIPIASMDVESWRQRVALVPQRAYLFDASALDNLRLARSNATLDEVRHAAELSGADTFLRGLPEGYDTRLGERGARLSRGQAQRLAIARAFLKNAPLLILDEPTSALDPESERAVRHSLERLGDGRTVVIVAHRLNTVVTANQIVVLSAGHVVERGCHRDLLQRGGPYASLVGARRRKLVG